MLNREADVLYLSRADVECVALPMDRIIDALEGAFRAHGAGRVEMPPKPGIHPLPDAFIHAMPACIPELGAAGVKWVSGFPQNTARGLPYISGLLILNDPHTGVPTAVMDCTWVTAMRTGAATALAAVHLARPDSDTVGIIAAGVQGRSNLEALCCRFPIRRVRAFDVHREVAERYAAEMGAALGVEVEVVASPREAVVGCDIVVTSGPILRDPEPVIAADWLEPGAFASPVDFDSYWRGDALRQVDVLATDDRGQLSYYRDQGYFSDTPEPHTDLGSLVCGRHPGRTSSDQRTMAVNLGVALEDMATAPLILAEARARGIGTELAL